MKDWEKTQRISLFRSSCKFHFFKRNLFIGTQHSRAKNLHERNFFSCTTWDWDFLTRFSNFSFTYCRLTINRFRILNFVTFFFSFHFINFYKASCVRKPSIYEFAFPHKRSFLKNLKFKDASRINSQNVDTIEFQYFLDIFL